MVWVVWGASLIQCSPTLEGSTQTKVLYWSWLISAKSLAGFHTTVVFEPCFSIVISRAKPLSMIFTGCVCSKNMESNIDAVAATDTKVLVLNYEKCTSMCQNACTRHKVLINNLFDILSKENIELIQKIENVSQKSIRDKLLTYLSNEARKRKSHSFEIPFNRQDLADYLNIDRSAMSFELSKLQKEGLIRYNKNHLDLSA